MDNDSNLPVPIDGQNSANIGTDVYPISGGTAHAQVVKVAWGNSLNVNRADEDTPLPVKIFGLTGSLATVTVTGSVGGLGKFTVTNTVSDPLQVTGGVRAFVSGTTGGTPVAVTGGVYILGNVGITGAVNVTGGRFLSHTTDSVQVTGSVARGWVLNNADDNLRIWSHSGGTLIPSAIYSSSGVGIGASGNALNVNVIGAAINATVTVGATVGIDNAVGTVLRVQGTANGTPIPVSLSSLPIVSLNDNGPNSTTNPLFVDTTPSPVNIGSKWTNYDAANGFEKLLIANKLGGTVLHSAGQWLSFLWDAVGEKSSTEAGTLQKKLTDIQTTLQERKSSVDFVVDPFVFAISMINPGNNSFTINNIKNKVNIDLVTKANGFLYTNKTDIPVYLVSQSYLNQIGINDACNLVGSAACPVGVSVSVTGTLTPDYTITTDSAIATQIKNASYEIPANQSALLPALYTKVFMLTAPTSGNVLTITAV